MKGLIIAIVLVLLVFGLVFLTKNKNNSIITESDIAVIEEEKSKEPTVEELLEVNFGISEEDAEAKYAPFMNQPQ